MDPYTLRTRAISGAPYVLPILAAQSNNARRFVQFAASRVQTFRVSIRLHFFIYASSIKKLRLTQASKLSQIFILLRVVKAVAKEIKILEKTGNELKLPHSKPLGYGLFELRERRFGYRIYYGFINNNIIILVVAGNKKSQKSDIKIARERLKN